MKLLSAISVLLVALAAPALALANEALPLTRSASKLLNDNSQTLSEKLASSPIIQAGQSKQRDSLNTTVAKSPPQYRQASRGTVTGFEIFDAWVELTGDINNNDYFHNIQVTFDADVNTPMETVYAKLYLSYEGGPWQQYAETDDFEIFYDSRSDTYEVISELVEGYPTGDYDVLIDLHSDDYIGIVASMILVQDIDGYTISLEDLQHDEIYNEEPVYLVGVGSFSWIGLLIFGLMGLVKFRFFRPIDNPRLQARKRIN